MTNEGFILEDNSEFKMTDLLKESLINNLGMFLKSILDHKSDEERFKLVQRSFLVEDYFDKAMIYFLRIMTKNFIEKHHSRSINGLPIEMMPIVEDEGEQTLDGYV